MAILASGHKLVRCGIDGAISGVVTDETLSGNGTSGEPLGALLENVIFDDSITESSTDFGTLIGVNPLWVNYVVTGGGSSGGDPQVKYIVNTYSGAWNDTTSVVQSNSAHWAEGGSGDVEVNSYVYDNSATINEVNTTFQNNSGNYLTAVFIPESSTWNDVASTYQTASSTYITAHQDVSNKLDITAFTSWSATQEANDYELSAGIGVTLYDDTVNKITRIDVTATGGDEEVNTLVHSNSSTWNDVTNKLDKSESANYYPMTGNPSKFIPQSALNLKINKISGIGGSALSVGNHNAVTFPLSDGFAGIDIGIPYDNGYLQHLSTDHISEVTLTTMPKVGNYKISANSAEYIIPGNSWITFYEQRNSEGQYRWTIKDYNGSGVLTSATSTTTGGVPQSAFDELKQSYDALSALVATYSGQWLLQNEGI